MKYVRIKQIIQKEVLFVEKTVYGHKNVNIIIALKGIIMIIIIKFVKEIYVIQMENLKMEFLYF